MSFKSELHDVQKKIDLSLRRELEHLSSPSLRLQDALQYGGLTAGKRLRAFLHKVFANHFRVPEAASTLVGTAIELVHTYSLIHDDLPCMDDSPLRRGLPTVHCQFDPATALLTGTALLTHGLQVLTYDKVHKDPAVRCQLVQALATAIGAPGMMSGQMLDLEGEVKLYSVEQIMEMQHLKTGALFRFCCEAAAILAKESEEIQTHLRTFAYHFGLAFQIKDDVLDFTATEDQIGKAVGQDTQKSTFVRLMGLAEAKNQIDFHGHRALDALSSANLKIPAAEALVAYVMER